MKQRDMILLVALVPTTLAALLLPTTRPLAPAPTHRAPSPRSAVAGEALDVLIQRNEEGGLGVLVDQDNTIVTVTAQPGLRVGDVIVGVDGDPLEGKPVGQCLAPGAPSYTFSVMRPSSAEAAESLERVLAQFLRDGASAAAKPDAAAALCFADDDEQGSQAEKLVASLEEAGASALPDDEALGAALRSGFWRLALVSQQQLAAGGLTGYGLAPFCSVRGSYQAFIDLKGEQTAQVVEVVANANTGSCQIAALKGTWHAAAEAGGVGVLERYERTEYGGQPEIGAATVENGWACTYLSERLRVCRLHGAAEGEGEWRVYVKQPAGDAQADIGRLLEMFVAPIARDGPPDWADNRLGGGGGGFGGGDGPMPEPDAMR